MTDNSSKIILDLCGGTGAWSKPYADAGYDVRVLTLPDFDVGQVFYDVYNNEVNNKTLLCYDFSKTLLYYDFRKLIQSNSIYGILAAPPCTQFSTARNDKTAKNPRDLREGMRIVQACLDIIHECLYSPYRACENSLKFWALENPDGYLKRFLGKPALKFDPCDYGDPYTKKTHIWGMFNKPKYNFVAPDLGTMVKHASKDSFKTIKSVNEEYRKKLGVDARTIRRSITPEGFAKAFFEANK